MSPGKADLSEVFTSGQAKDVGVTERMLRGPRFRRLLRNVYVAAEVEVTPAVRARAALIAVPESVLSHRSAAQAQRLPLGIDEALACEPHVTVSRRSLVPRDGVRRHTAPLPPERVVATTWGPATSPARTYFDRSTELCFADQVALGAILRRGLATVDDLVAMVAWGAGRRGARQARQGLPLLDPRAESAMESWARVRFVCGGLPAPEVNAVIRDRVGGWLARCDFVWRAARLIVEYDGIVHLSERQRRDDARRRALLIAEGWTVLTITADDVLRRPDAMIATIAQVLARAA